MSSGEKLCGADLWEYTFKQARLIAIIDFIIFIKSYNARERYKSFVAWMPLGKIIFIYEKDLGYISSIVNYFIPD